jgi:hypothetical protein
MTATVTTRLVACSEEDDVGGGAAAAAAPAPRACSHEGSTVREWAARRREELGERWLVGLGADPLTHLHANTTNHPVLPPSPPPRERVTPSAIVEALVPDWGELTLLAESAGWAQPDSDDEDVGGDDETEQQARLGGHGLGGGEQQLRDMAAESVSAAERVVQAAMRASEEATRHFDAAMTPSVRAEDEADDDSSHDDGAAEGGWGGGAAGKRGGVQRKASSLTDDEKAQIALIMAEVEEPDDQRPGSRLGRSRGASTTEGEESSSGLEEGQDGVSDGEGAEPDEEDSGVRAGGGGDGRWEGQEDHAVITSGLMWSQGQNFGGWKQVSADCVPTFRKADISTVIGRPGAWVRKLNTWTTRVVAARSVGSSLPRPTWCTSQAPSTDRRPRAPSRRLNARARPFR